jgi:biopolymer transport protein ExbD
MRVPQLTKRKTVMAAREFARSPTAKASDSQAKPNINVTPLIDVLLVMLIIFMVVSPLKPARFLTKVPSEPDRSRKDVRADPNTLLVTIKTDRTLMLNGIENVGTVSDTSRLSTMLLDLFQERLQNHDYRYDLRDRTDLSEDNRIQKTVFIKAPRGLPYVEVMRVLDGIKGAGAGPIGLQIDDLN